MLVLMVLPFELIRSTVLAEVVFAFVFVMFEFSTFSSTKLSLSDMNAPLYICDVVMSLKITLGPFVTV